jgi:CRISPR-associated exonuclease Cas4
MVNTQISADLAALTTTGTAVNYFFICQRKLWLFSKKLSMEHSSDDVYLGKLLHETSYRYKSQREVTIDNLIKVDIAEGDQKIHEVKLSRKMEQAHHFQLLYYLYYLKQRGVKNLVGEINYPKLRRKEEVKLLPEDEHRIEEALVQIHRLEGQSEPPEAEFTRLCKRCSYQELCWG